MIVKDTKYERDQMRLRDTEQEMKSKRCQIRRMRPKDILNLKKKNYETQRFACLEIKKYRPCKRFKFDFTIFYNDANKSEFEIKNLSELIEQL